MEQTPQNSTQEDLIAGQPDQLLDFEIQAHEAGVRKARNALFLIAAAVTVSEFVSAFVTHTPFTSLFFGIVIFEAGIFVGLALLTKYKPYLAILLGLIAFILLWALSIWASGITAAYSGILFKILIITYLIKALSAAKALETARSEKKLL